MKKNICIEISFQHCGGKVSVNDISNVYFVNTRKFLYSWLQKKNGNCQNKIDTFL
jgi:hypothetical protein